MMNLREYTEKIATEVNGTVKEIEKANGVTLTGIEIQTGTSIRPIIYTNSYYENKISINDAIDDIKKIISDNAIPDFNNIKDKLTLRLYNKTTNAELFISAKYMGFDDLILVPYIQITDEAYTRVTKELIKKWGINAETLFAIAFLNLTNDTAEVKLLTEMLGMSTDVLPLYVITNKSKSFGAIEILTPTVKKKLEEIFPNGYTVLPSSVHEVIAVEGNEPYFLEMVKQINATEVKPEEVLSDNVYYFTVNK